MAGRAALLLFAELLEYPDATLSNHVRCLRDALGQEPELESFAAFVESESLTRVQELYTTTFDLNPVCCPYIAFHLFGESFKRGALMAKLREAYQEHRFSTDTAELPDHLSVVLRFVATCADAELSKEIVSDLAVPALRTMAGAFAGESNPYGGVLRALLATLARPSAPALAKGVLDV